TTLDTTTKLGGTVQLVGGTINGGTVSGTLTATTSGGTLNGVTLNTNLDLTAASSVVTVTNGLTLNGTATLGNFARLDFSGTQSLTTTSTTTPGTVVFNNFNCNSVRETVGGATLTLGPSIVVRGGSNVGDGARLGYNGNCFGGPS